VREASYHERYQQPDKVTEDGEEGEWPVPYWWFDSGSLLVMLQMAAANEGLATGFFGPHADGLAELVGLPADVGLSGIMTLGYSDDNDRGVPGSLTNRPKRIPLDGLVTWRGPPPASFSPHVVHMWRWESNVVHMWRLLW
jgi:FMN reductase [NAD(P)H]